MSSGIFGTQDILRPQDFGRRDDSFPEDRPSAGCQSRIVIISDARLYREGLALSLESIDRLLQSFGHSVKLIAPQLVKPYVKLICPALAGDTWIYRCPMWAAGSMDDG